MKVLYRCVLCSQFIFSFLSPGKRTYWHLKQIATLIIFPILFFGTAHGQIPATINAAGTWSASSGPGSVTFAAGQCYEVTVEAWGGGGGGGGASNNGGASGGGAGGGFASGVVTISGGSACFYSVGTGGTAGTTAGANGGPGGPTWFNGTPGTNNNTTGSFINGGGGDGGNGATTNAGAAGQTTLSVSTFGTTGVTNTVSYTGGTGGGGFYDGQSGDGGGGGGGAGAGSGGNGGNGATTIIGGTGAFGCANAGGGGGGGGGSATGAGANGNPGNNNGGGGTGGAANGGGAGGTAAAAAAGTLTAATPGGPGGAPGGGGGGGNGRCGNSGAIGGDGAAGSSATGTGGGGGGGTGDAGGGNGGNGGAYGGGGAGADASGTGFAGGAGGSGYLTITVALAPPPTATAGPALAAICQGATTTIMNGSVSAGATALWSGGTGTWTNPTDPVNATYTAGATETGTITLTLTATSACGTGTDTKTITINPPPAANFTSAGGCVNTPISFSDASTPAGSITGWTWDFGDGTATSPAQNPAHTYATAGTYQVKLTVSWPPCTADTTISVTIGAPPASTFTASGPVCVGQTSTITYTGNGTYPADSFSWIFDGGTIISGSGAGPFEVTWNTAGTKNLSLTVSSGGCASVVTPAQVVVNASPGITVSPLAIICAGTSTTLTASGATTYTWAPNVGLNTTTGPSVIASPATSVIYTVTGSTSSCQITGLDTVVVSPVPLLSATSTTVCAGTSATLTATATAPGGVYSWNPGGLSGASINVTPNSTTTYTVTYTQLCGTPTATGTVTVNPLPMVTVNSTAICPGGSATLSATPNVGGGSYAWNPGGSMASSITVSPVTATTYTVTYTAPQCGNATGTGTVSITNAATVTVSDTSVCTGDSASLYAMPSVQGGTYSWAPGGYTTQVISFIPAGTTTYTVTYSSPGCGSPTGSGTATVLPVPTLNLSEKDPGCYSPDSGVITATGAGTTAPYKYSLNAGPLQSTDSFVVAPGGTYVIIAVDANGCPAAPQLATVGTYTPMSLSLAVTDISCQNPTGQIVANAAGGFAPYTYSANGGALQDGNTFSNLPAGFYTIRVTDTTQCPVSDTATIIQPALVTVTAVADSAECFGTPSSGKIFATASAGSPPYQFALNSRAYQSSDTFEFVPAGTDTVTVMDAGGCISNTQVTVYQPNPMQFISVSSTPVTCPGLNTGTITVVAAGGTPPYTYSSTQDSFNINSTTAGTIVDLDSGAYLIILNDAHGCTLDTSAYVPGATPDVYASAADSASCYGSSDGSVTVTGSPGTHAPFKYSIDSGGVYQDTNVFSNLVAGIYHITAQDTNGCITNLAPITVGQPTAGIANAYPLDSTITAGKGLQLLATLTLTPAPSSISYLWSPAFGLSCIDCPNPVATPYSDGNVYTVQITYNGHCTSDASVTLNVTEQPKAFIPNSFTPNGDGNNDVFQVYGVGIKYVTMKIFNRWGELVYETNDMFQGWDGTYKGRLQEMGVYVYEANITYLNNSIEFRKGSITLIR